MLGQAPPLFGAAKNDAPSENMTFNTRRVPYLYVASPLFSYRVNGEHGSTLNLLML